MQGYQLFTQALGILELKEARDAFLSSLCSFALSAKMAEDADGDLPLSPVATPSGSGKLYAFGNAVHTHQLIHATIRVYLFPMLHCLLCVSAAATAAAAAVTVPKYTPVAHMAQLYM